MGSSLGFSLIFLENVFDCKQLSIPFVFIGQQELNITLFSLSGIQIAFRVKMSI